MSKVRQIKAQKLMFNLFTRSYTSAAIAMEVVLHSQPLTQSENVTSTPLIHVDPSNGEQAEHDEEAIMMDSAYGTSRYEKKKERERERERENVHASMILAIRLL